MVQNATKKRKFKVPHTYVILFSVILLMALLTYFIPAGEYDRILDEATDRIVVDPGSYHQVEQNPIKFFELFN